MDDYDEGVSGAVAAPQMAELPEIKLFARWSCDDVQVSDMSLQVCDFFDRLWKIKFN